MFFLRALLSPEHSLWLELQENLEFSRKYLVLEGIGFRVRLEPEKPGKPGKWVVFGKRHRKLEKLSGILSEIYLS